MKTALRMTDAEKDLVLRPVLAAVIEQFGVSEAALFSRRRPETIADARQVVLYLMRHSTNYHLVQIAACFGFHHGTVSHACKAVRDKCDTRPAFAAKVAAVKAKLEIFRFDQTG